MLWSQIVVLSYPIGRRWRLAGAGDWQALETGRRWRQVDAGEWEALENGRRWILGAGDFVKSRCLNEEGQKHSDGCYF
jgi:hypothetical protein